MEFNKAKKVVIITEASILDDVIEVLTELGASGYTVTSVTGKGTRGGIRHGTGFSDLFKNVKIDIITGEEIAKKIAGAVVEKLLKDYAGIVYMEDVETIHVKTSHSNE